MTHGLFNKLTIDSVDVKGKCVLIRADFDVPLLYGKTITNNRRIVTALPSIKYCLENGAKAVILMSHLGSPNGLVQERYSLAPVAAELQNLLARNVTFSNDCVGPDVEATCANPATGSVILLENLRFHIEEQGRGLGADGRVVIADEMKVKEFGESLTKLGDIYVNDAFAVSHRLDVSMIGADLEKRAAGLLLKKEISYFAKVQGSYFDPLLVILSGRTVKDNIHLISKMLDAANEMIIAGNMALNFLKFLNNMKIGSSFYDEDGAKSIPQIMSKAKQLRIKIHFPFDFVTGDKFAEHAKVGNASVSGGIPDGWFGLDVGTQSNKAFGEVNSRSKMILWNGPPGIFQYDNFATGAKAMMDNVVAATEKGSTSVISDEDTAEACTKYNTEEKVSHVSAGGEAVRELLEGKNLPGIFSLSDP